MIFTLLITIGATKLVKIYRAKRIKRLKIHREIVLAQGDIHRIADHGLKNIYHHIQPGVRVDLVKEPSNKVDPNAIAIWFKGFKLGFIPRDLAPKVGEMLERKLSITAQIATIYKESYLPPSKLCYRITTS